MHMNPRSRTTTMEGMQSYIGGVKLGLPYNPKELVMVPATCARTLINIIYKNNHNA